MVERKTRSPALLMYASPAQSKTIFCPGSFNNGLRRSSSKGLEVMSSLPLRWKTGISPIKDKVISMESR